MANIFQGFFPEIREKRTRVRGKPCAEGTASMVVHLGALEPVGNLEAGGQALGVRAFLPRDSQESSLTPQFRSINSLALSLLQPLVELCVEPAGLC